MCVCVCVCACACFVMCGGFDNCVGVVIRVIVCTVFCIVCTAFLYCCVYVYFILICFVWTNVRTTATV